MAGIFLVDGIRRNLRERARKQRIAQATAWPLAIAEINTWKILSLGDEAESFTQSNAIESAFSFVLNGEYYGGYLRSVGMGHKEAESVAVGNPQVNVRYNPANPDQVAVLAEDNPTLPFAIISG